MRPVLARRLAWLNLSLCLALTAAAVVLFFLNWPGPAWRLSYDLEILGQSAMTLLFPLVGLLIVSHRPGHRVGWIFCLIGLSSSLGVFGTQYTIYGLLDAAAPLGLAAEWNLLRSIEWLPRTILLVALLLFFPDGRLPGRRWRWVWRGTLISFALMMFLWALDGGWANRHVPGIRPPSSASGPAGAGVRPYEWFLVPILAAVPVSAISLLVRWRRADRVGRQQLKWFALAGGWLGGLVFLGEPIVNWLFPGEVARTVALNVVGFLSTGGVAMATGVAILRHRLYDIDLVIRKTLVYAVLTALLALAYFGSVVLLQGLLAGAGGSQQPLVIVVSTLLIAALFSPLRRRVQGLIDRRFFRRKYDAGQLLAAFAVAARDETDLDRLASTLTGAVIETMQPARISLWLAPGRSDPGG